MARADRVSRGALLAILRASARLRSRVLGYHGVGERSDRDRFSMLVAPEDFRTQLELLLEAGFEFVTADALASELQAGASAPGRVALTFDDGMEDNHRVVLPMLREYGIPATFYVVTGLLGKPNPFLDGTRLMTEDELRDAAAQGIEIGAHTVTHPDLSTLSYDECLREMVESRDRVAALVGRPATTFAYPFCRFGPEAMVAARAAGFRMAVACDRGGKTPYDVGRAMISPRQGLGQFALKVAGVHEPIAARYRAVKRVAGTRHRARSGRSA